MERHGAQFLALALAKELSSRPGVQVVVLAAKLGSLAADFRRVSVLETVRKDDFKQLARAIQRWKKRGVDRALINSAATSWMADGFSDKGVRIVGLVHEMKTSIQNLRASDSMSKLAQCAEKLVFPANLVKCHTEQIIGRDVDDAVLMPQGVFRASARATAETKSSAKNAIALEYGFDPETNIILCVGNGDYRKGIDLFTEWARSAEMSDVPMTFIWVGPVDPGMAHHIGEMAQYPARVRNMIFPGFVENLSQFYLAADLFALSSREDPFPSVALDALTHLTPVLTVAGCTGVDDLKRTGAVMPIEDKHPETFLSMVINVLADRRQLSVRAAAGRDEIRRSFGFRSYVDELVRLFDSTKRPRISVVLPNYNYGRYLEARISSILNQTYPPSQIIFLDDASTDQSAEVAERLLSAGGIAWQFVKNAQNSGSVFSQWQKGVGRAEHDLIWIAEADDMADPSFLDRVVPMFDDPEVVMAYCQSRRIDKDGRVLAPDYAEYLREISPDRWQQHYIVDGENELANAMSIKNPIPNVSGVVFRNSDLKSVIQELGDDLCQWRVAGDWRIYAEMMRRGKVAYAASPLNAQRIHDASVTKKKFDLSDLREIVSMQRFIRENCALEADMVFRATKYTLALVSEHRLSERFGEQAVREVLQGHVCDLNDCAAS